MKSVSSFIFKNNKEKVRTIVCSWRVTTGSDTFATYNHFEITAAVPPLVDSLAVSYIVACYVIRRLTNVKCQKCGIPGTKLGNRTFYLNLTVFFDVFAIFEYLSEYEYPQRSSKGK